MTNMVCAACILGISIGIGGVFLYRVLRLWLHQSSDSKHLSFTSDNRARQKIDGADCSSEVEVLMSFSINPVRFIDSCSSFSNSAHYF